MITRHGRSFRPDPSGVRIHVSLRAPVVVETVVRVRPVMTLNVRAVFSKVTIHIMMANRRLVRGVVISAVVGAWDRWSSGL